MCVRLGWVMFELVTWPGTPRARGMSRPFLTSFFRDYLYVFSLHFRFRRRDLCKLTSLNRWDFTPGAEQQPHHPQFLIYLSFIVTYIFYLC